MSISGNEGTIAFTDDSLATTSQNYLVVTDFDAPINVSYMTVNLNPSKITMTDTHPTYFVYGSVQSVQHNRNNRGGGGSGASVGGPAPAGDGDVGGGGVQSGELIGSNPDYYWPTSNSGSWNNGALAYDGIDGTYATTTSTANHSYTDHGFGVPGTNVVGGIEVKLELSGSTAVGTVDVQLSWDGGITWTDIKSTPTLTTNDAVRTLGSPSDLWGRAWTPGEFSNANFAIRITGNPNGNTIRIDAIQVRVYHIAGGGGGGGGGGEI